MAVMIKSRGGSALSRIIENLKDKLLDEACLQIDKNGYSAMTMQSISKACGVAVGTVYNYYASKDEILEAYFFRKWDKCVERIYIVSRYSQTYDAVIHCIYDQIHLFKKEHAFLFQEENVVRVIESVMYRFQGLLCRQLAQPLRKFCESDIDAEIIAEALMIWIQTGKSYADIFKNIAKLTEIR